MNPISSIVFEEHCSLSQPSKSYVELIF